jgi:TRAP-type C4-dicarboxylate transport system permease small subunit
MVLGFASIMIWLGLQLTLAVFADPYARSATLQIPDWYFYAVLPAMGGMMFLRTLMVMVEDWRGEKNL